MLDFNVKRKIDNARDILVGKIPDPKAQVEQITIALIYKFMYDMDQQSVEFDGKAQFFTGDFEKYGWNHLIDQRTSGQERLNLYAEAVTKMTQNENLPKLFRDIFSGAFLPYRDPETLRLFLKEINGFVYDHSERLGDAYEYLLMILGAQGDAGQFRTPRHLIDFIVEVVDPQKEDTILDPACGTAGFLISAYKHILNSNMKKVPGDLLSPEQKKKIMSHFVGYDISPDMVRLSRVNMYLHGFTTPQIFEYDTLTSEERWIDNFDVVLANPPFMTPKGGIRPHKRFSIEASRSEVLFADYMAEHLNVRGRSGFIVPEGIIFQSGKAYKSLRKMLVDQNYLYAVVSLPAGVFNPYSGVKTSILFFDKHLAKKAKDILFVTIENDGYELGAQRRASTKDDLPDAVIIIKNFREAVLSGKEFQLTEPEKKLAHAVPKTTIAESGDYNLTGSRYKEAITYTNKKWPLVQLRKVCLINKDSVEPRKTYGEKYFIYIDIASVNNGTGYINYNNLIKGIDAPTRAKRKIKKDDILISTVRPNLKAFAYLGNPPENAIASTGFAVLSTRRGSNPKYIYNLFFSSSMMHQMINKMGKGSYPSINQKDLETLEIPLPPLEVQEQIVEELDRYQKIIDGARQVIDNYKPAISIDPDWPMLKLGEICDIKTGKLNANQAVTNGKYPFFTCSREVFQIDDYAFDCEAVLLSGNNATGNFDVKYYKGKFNAYQRTYVITIKKTYSSKINYLLLKITLENNLEYLKSNSIGGLTRYLTLNMIQSLKVPLPSLEIQQHIVSQIEEEQCLVESNKQLIEIFERKIQNIINEVWGIEENESV